MSHSWSLMIERARTIAKRFFRAEQNPRPNLFSYAPVRSFSRLHWSLSTCTKDLPDISREISLHNAEDSRITDTVKPVKKNYPCTTQKILIKLDFAPQITKNGHQPCGNARLFNLVLIVISSLSRGDILQPLHLVIRAW